MHHLVSSALRSQVSKVLCILDKKSWSHIDRGIYSHPMEAQSVSHNGLSDNSQSHLSSFSASISNLLDSLVRVTI